MGKVMSIFPNIEGEFYENQSFYIGNRIELFAVAPMWAQQKSPDANLLVQLFAGESSRLVRAKLWLKKQQAMP